MKQLAAPTSLGIKTITGFYCLLVASLPVLSLFAPPALRLVPLATAVALALVGWICWRLKPLAFELQGDTLSVHRRSGKVVFPGVRQVAKLPAGTRLGIKLCGNDGLFAATGWFWSRKLGIYRAFLTHTTPAELVAIHTRRRIIILSPDQPDLFIAAATGAEAPHE